MKKEIEQYIDNMLFQLKDFYGSHNDWEHFSLVLKPELRKLAEQAFWRGQEDVIKTEWQEKKNNQRSEEEITKKDMKEEKCPYCGAELNPEIMSEEAYREHYDARCQDKN